MAGGDQNNQVIETRGALGLSSGSLLVKHKHPFIPESSLAIMSRRRISLKVSLAKRSSRSTQEKSESPDCQGETAALPRLSQAS
ncbi:unnamed protein product [Caretta caretta]